MQEDHWTTPASGRVLKASLEKLHIEALSSQTKIAKACLNQFFEPAQTPALLDVTQSCQLSFHFCIA